MRPLEVTRLTPLRQELLSVVTHDFVVNDDQLDALHAAANHVGDVVKSKPATLTPYALAAIDPGVAENAPAILDAEQAVVTHWQALRSQHKARPTALLRYVLLLGLQEAAEASPNLAAALYLSIVNPVQRMPATAEGSTLRKYLDSLYARYDEAVEAAMQSATVEIQEPKAAKATAVALTATAREALATALLNAVQNGEILTAAGHQPNGPWATKFSTQAADGLKAALDSLGTGVSKVLESRLAGDEQVLKLLREAARETKVTERRVNLLWWAQARYSHRLRLRYRDLRPWVAAIAMAEDLWRLAPDPIGSELEALFEEVHFAVFGEESAREAPVLDGLKLLADDPALGSLGAPTGELGGRLLMCDFVRALRAGTIRPTETTIKGAIGVSGKLKLTPGSLGVWHLRTLSAAHLVTPE